VKPRTGSLRLVFESRRRDRRAPPRPIPRRRTTRSAPLWRRVSPWTG